MKSFISPEFKAEGGIGWRNTAESTKYSGKIVWKSAFVVTLSWCSGELTMLPDSVLHALKRTWDVLEKDGVEAALLGGIAVSIWKHVRATKDVDLILSIPAGQVRDVIDGLCRAGFRPRSHPPHVVHLDGVDLVQFDVPFPDSYIEVGVDVQFAKSDFHQQVVERRIRQAFPEFEFECDIVSCEDLLLLKLHAGRAIDLADAAYVLRFNAHEIDIEYLLRWGEKLKVSRELCLIWDEAFPGLAPPNLPPKDEEAE